MLTGFTPPYSATGRSSLVPSPPWHYAGRVISFALDLDPDGAASFLPSGFGPPTGRGFGHFCEWQATTDGRELIDPAYAQYNEFFLLLEAASHPERPRLFCPFIYVDQDISMVRGHMQGWPKKMGSVRITRSYDLDHPAAARRVAKTKMGATLAVKDRRLAEAEWTLTGDRGQAIGFLATPTFGLVATPTLIGGPDRGVPRLVRQAVSETAIGDVLSARGQLRLHPSPWDELGAIEPRATTAVSLCEFALTVTGVTEARL